MEEQKRTERIALFALIASFVAAVLLARMASADEQSHPCGAEIRSICGEIAPGSGRLRECLRDHRSEFSPECRQRIEAFRERREKLRGACQEDVKSFCGEVEPGRANIFRCLQQHRSELSEGCRQTLAERQQWHGYHKGPPPEADHGGETP